MEQYILLCLDCHEIFADGVNHSCRKYLKTHFTSRVDAVNKQITRLDGKTIKYYESSCHEEETYDQLLIQNSAKILSSPEESTLNINGIEPACERSIPPTKSFGLSIGASSVQKQSENSHEGLSELQAEGHKSNLDSTQILQDHFYNHCTARIADNLCMGGDYPMDDNLPLISPRSMDDSAGPSNGWNLTEQCEPMDLEVHRREEVEYFVCPFCRKSIRGRFDFDVHYRTHTCEKPYACDLCDKKYAKKKILGKHRKTHTGEKPNSCDVCDKRFITRWELTEHSRTHTGEKPHVCDLCDKKFTTKGQLVVHRRSHTGEKPYACDMCDKSFITGWDLTKHRRTHTGEKAYACDMCDKKYTKKQLLERHRKTHTGETQ